MNSTFGLSHIDEHIRTVGGENTMHEDAGFL
jgi:hypothetical protein